MAIKVLKLSGGVETPRKCEDDCETLTPASSREVTTSSCPCLAARATADSLSSFTAAASALACKRRATTSACPFSRAGGGAAGRTMTNNQLKVSAF